jgi:imidazolonepropionase-like amidohydrolase
MNRLLILLSFCLLLSGRVLSQAPSTLYLIHCGRLFDGRNSTIREKVSLYIKDGKIEKIEDGLAQAEPGRRLIDMSQMTVLPGLIDSHVHVETETSKSGYLERYQLNAADFAYKAEKNARTLLMAGFTTVRDLGGSGVNISLRNAITMGYVVGPRILTCGKSIATTGGHADPSNGIRKELDFHPGPEAGVANGADECRQAVRQQYKNGADLIKITATGGVLSLAKDGKAPQFFDDELEAIIKTAKDYNMPVAAHAHGTEGIKRALRAGVTSIEHGTYLDDEAVTLFKQKGAWYVPTLIAGRSTVDSAKIPGYYPKVVERKALVIGGDMMTAFRRAYKGGVKIAFGTDAGVFRHGENWREFTYMVEGGMKPIEALRSATLEASRLCGIEAETGTLEAGKAADIIAVRGNPDQDVTVLRSVPFVMMGGKVVKE